MPLRKIKTRTELLKKIFAAFEDAKSEGIKDPLAVLRKALDKRVQIKNHNISRENK
jgi:hypothetical protein